MPGLAELLTRKKTEFWGDTCEFQPVLLNKIYGDGKKLLQLFPINERPRYWVIRVDSSCGDNRLFKILEDIYDEIDDQFGRPTEEDLGIGDERPYFPMHDGEGASWHFVPEEG